ncbi:MAG TPA: hypothetical protein VF768_00025 [Holophagaceae bacterium]
MWKRLHTLILCLGLVGAGAQLSFAASPSPRPQVTALTVVLDDGRTYNLSPSELSDARGGALFWNDWAVYNLLFPYCLFHAGPGPKPEALIRAWNGPAANGELPAFLVFSGGEVSYPLNPAAPGTMPWGMPFRCQVASITVGLADGRSYSLSDLELRDARSGVLLWTDFAVNRLLVPFYARNTSLPTNPGDVIQLWNTARPAIRAGAASLQASTEAPAFLVKPLCIPRYPLADE